MCICEIGSQDSKEEQGYQLQTYWIINNRFVSAADKISKYICTYVGCIHNIREYCLNTFKAIYVDVFYSLW